MQRPKHDRPPLRWDDIQIFVGLLRHPSMSRASRALGVDTSTLSRRMAALEERLGLVLFDRTAAGVRVTPAAEKLASAARAMESSALAFEREAENFERRIEGLVRISAPPGVIEGLVIPTLPRLSSRYSRIVIDLDASTSVRDLNRRETDIGIRSSRPATGSLTCRKVYSGPPWPLGSLAYVQSLGKVRSLEECRWVGASEGPDPFPPPSGGVPPVVRAANQLVQIRAAATGVGLVWTARHFGHTFGLAPLRVVPKLEKVLLGYPPIELWMVAHESHRNVPRIAAVWDFLEEEFRALGATAKDLDRAETVGTT